MRKTSDFNYERKAEARTALAGHLGTIVISIVIVAIIDLVLSDLSTAIFSGMDTLSLIGSEAVDFLVSLFIGAMYYGLCFQQLSLIYGQKTTIADLFGVFRRGAGDRIIKVQAVLSLADTLCFLPATIYSFVTLDGTGRSRMLLLFLIIAGFAARVFVDLSFAAVYFLLADFEEMNPMDIIRTSVRMMKGNRVKLLLMKLSFIPLLLVGLISFGIADLWVFAYELGADASFYRWLTSQGASRQ